MVIFFEISTIFHHQNMVKKPMVEGGGEAGWEMGLTKFFLYPLTKTGNRFRKLLLTLTIILQRTEQ